MVSLLAFCSPKNKVLELDLVYSHANITKSDVYSTYMLVNTSCYQNQKGSKYQKNARVCKKR